MTPQTRTLVLVRHGQSEWNLANRFTGWVDVDLSPGGVAEARRAGETLRRGGFVFDLAFTSVLKRAIRTLWLILDEMDCLWLPVHKRIALNERHYGALQGLDKAETAERHGAEQVRMWRRSFDVRPPLLDAGDPLHPSRDPRYAELEKLPGGESLADTIARVIPCWEREIKPGVAAGRRIIISAHGNSLRALVKHLDGISDNHLMTLEIPTGRPLVYEFGAQMEVRRRFYLEGEGEGGAQK